MLGYAHPDYLLKELTSRQITEWYAYDILEPMDDRLGWAILSSVVSNIALSLYSDKPKYTKPDDFLLNKEKTETEQTVDEQKNILMGLMRMSGGGDG